MSRHILMLTNERRYQSKAAAALVEAMWEMATEMQARGGMVAWLRDGVVAWSRDDVGVR